MKTGTVLTASFHLKTHVASFMGQPYWRITPNPARIENPLTGAGGFSAGAGLSDRSDNSVWINFMPRGVVVDVKPICPPGQIPPGIEETLEYVVNVAPTADGNLEGTMRLMCSGTGFLFDTQLIVMRRTEPK
ncbi:MAG: hypothetical protein M3Q18_06665 [Actinomycetota bacterium]|nr:hypothetical protein [Actinomycetota bacterium]